MEREFIEGIIRRLNILKGNRSVKAFAEDLGLPVSTVYYYFNGREPSLSFLLRIANKMNVSEEWLLTGKGKIFKDKDGEVFDIEDILEFLKKNWYKWSEKKRQWFKINFEELFPEFKLWLKKELMR
ncbi:MAG: helix-turn-helix domain-containing protein [Thermodesulfovibrionales bacterium]